MYAGDSFYGENVLSTLIAASPLSTMTEPKVGVAATPAGHDITRTVPPTSGVMTCSIGCMETRRLRLPMRKNSFLI